MCPGILDQVTLQVCGASCELHVDGPKTGIHHGHTPDQDLLVGLQLGDGQHSFDALIMGISPDMQGAMLRGAPHVPLIYPAYSLKEAWASLLLLEHPS